MDPVGIRVGDGLMAEDARSARDLVQELRGRGLSNTEIAGELQRDPRMVRKILNGETSGRVYRATLIELATTGKATTVPPRRRTKDNQLVPVRTKRGAPTKSVIPTDTGGTYTRQKQGGRLRSTTYLGGGGRQHELNIPKGKTAKGRQAANDEILERVRAAARGQARDTQKQIKARVTYANGRVMEVNDYNASTMLKRINDDGGQALDWLRNESNKRYENLDVSSTPITGVTLTVYEAPKTPAYYREQARGRVRRTRTPKTTK
jgi:hypothetical protein